MGLHGDRYQRAAWLLLQIETFVRVSVCMWYVLFIAWLVPLSQMFWHGFQFFSKVHWESMPD